MSEPAQGRLDDIFARLRVAFGGEELPLRRGLVLDGDAVVVEDLGEVDEEIVITCDTSSVASKGQVLVASDVDHTISPTELRSLIFKCSGATANRNLLFPMPVTALRSYKRIVRVMVGDAGGRVVTVGAGETVTVPPGSTLQLLFTPEGVICANTAAPTEPDSVTSALFILVSWSAIKLASAFKATLTVRILVDSVVVAQGTASTNANGEGTSSTLQHCTGALGPGDHTVAVEWWVEAAHGNYKVTAATVTEGAHVYVREVPLP